MSAHAGPAASQKKESKAKDEALVDLKRDERARHAQMKKYLKSTTSLQKQTADKVRPGHP